MHKNEVKNKVPYTRKNNVITPTLARFSCTSLSGSVVFVATIVVTIMMQRHAVKLFKRVDNFVAGGGQANVERKIVHVHGAGSTDINALALFDVAKVEGVNTLALVRDNRRFHVPNKGPLSGAEKGMSLYIGCACASAETTILIFDQKLPNKRLAETGGKTIVSFNRSVKGSAKRQAGTYLEICGALVWSGNGISSRKILANVAFRFLPLKGVVP